MHFISSNQTIIPTMSYSKRFTPQIMLCGAHTRIHVCVEHTHVYTCVPVGLLSNIYITTHKEASRQVNKNIYMYIIMSARWATVRSLTMAPREWTTGYLKSHNYQYHPNSTYHILWKCAPVSSCQRIQTLGMCDETHLQSWLPHTALP